MIRAAIVAPSRLRHPAIRKLNRPLGKCGVGFNDRRIQSLGTVTLFLFISGGPIGLNPVDIRLPNLMLLFALTYILTLSTRLFLRML